MSPYKEIASVFSRHQTSTLVALAGLTFSGCAHTRPHSSDSANSRDLYSRSLEEQKTYDIINKSGEFARQLHQKLPRLETRYYAVVEHGKGLVATALPFGRNVQIDERPPSRISDAEFRAWAQRAAKVGERRIEEYQTKGIVIEALMITPHGYMFPLIDGTYNIGNIERVFPNAPSIADVEAERIAELQMNEERERLRHSGRSS